MQNQVRRKLEQGNNLLGMMHFTGSPMLIEVMASAGMDFVNRHGAQSDRHRAGGASHPRRRRCGNRRELSSRTPRGRPARRPSMPRATRPKVAAARARRFAPHATASAIGPATRARLTARSASFRCWRTRRRSTISRGILAVDGVDIVFLGPFDYSVALGIAGATFDHPIMAAALDRAVRMAKARDKYVMTSVGARIDTAYARTIFGRGVRLISYSADALVFLEACRAIVATGA
jgi:4-hydroxy-2-oxoheptanedioate aldolase